MKLDPAISAALARAVEDAHQPKAVAQLLTKWCEGLVSGNERFEDPESVARHIELLIEAVHLDDEEGGP